MEDKFNKLVNEISIRTVSITKTMTSPKTGAVHSIGFTADVGGASIGEAAVIAHVLGMKAESSVYLQLSAGDGIDPETKNKTLQKIRLSYGNLIGQEMENMEGGS